MIKKIFTPLTKNLITSPQFCFAKVVQPYNFINNFDGNIEELRQSIRNFADKEIAPIAEQTDKLNTFPDHLWPKFGELGIMGVTTPAEYGGLELGYTHHTLIMEEISRASGSVGFSYGAATALCIAQIERQASDKLRQKYLPRLLSGEAIGALAMSEPNAGSDVMSMKTRAEKKGDKWILNGNKMWITNGPSADILVVYAKTGEKMTAFIVEKAFKGFSTGQKLDKLGMRGSNTGELIFENCEVPEENVIGGLNKGAYVLMDGLDYERLVLSGGPVGIMQAAYDYSLEYMQTREQFGKKIGEFQIMQGKIADMYVKLQSSRSMLYSLCKAVDAKQEVSNTDCAAVLLYTSTCATQVCLEAIQTLGGNGYINEYPVGRMMRDAKIYEIAAGSNEIRRWLIGRQLISMGEKSN